VSGNFLLQSIETLTSIDVKSDEAFLVGEVEIVAVVGVDVAVRHDGISCFLYYCF
jgi:hypothetical protein